MLAAVIERTGGHKVSVTKLEALWISRVRAAAPDITSWRCYLLARTYATLVARGESTAALDVLLAFAPWRHRGALDRYMQATAAGPAALLEVQAPLWLVQLVVSDRFEAPEDLEGAVARGEAIELATRVDRADAAIDQREVRRGKKRAR